MTAKMTSAVPRSPSPTTSAAHQTGDRHHRHQQVPPLVEQLVLAGVEVGAHSTIASLATSDGWSTNGPPTRSSFGFR
jgi:hypothetical protein